MKSKAAGETPRPRCARQSQENFNVLHSGTLADLKPPAIVFLEQEPGVQLEGFTYELCPTLGTRGFPEVIELFQSLWGEVELQSMLRLVHGHLRSYPSNSYAKSKTERNIVLCRV